MRPAPRDGLRDQAQTQRSTSGEEVPVSKPPVKAATTSKAPARSGKTAKAGAAAPVVTRAAPAAPKAKVAAKVAVKTPPKAPGKAAPMTAAKMPAKVPGKVPAKVTPKVAPKAAAKTPEPAVPKAPPPSPAAKTPVVKSQGKATPAPAPRASAAKPTPKSPAEKPAQATPAPPVMPTPAPVSNRFTDRFAPARPSTRQMTETADIPKTIHKVDPKLANAWKHKAGRDLCEAELLAMPDSEYMNDKQLEFFRALLQRNKDDLLSNAGETTEHLREDTSIVPDPADRATIEEEHALELRTRDRERKLLKKVAQSLTRLENGDYGFCDETGEPIGLARLLARPTATLSLEAQQRRELKQKMFGD
jgi:DnaK suppressor protein